MSFNEPPPKRKRLDLQLLTHKIAQLIIDNFPENTVELEGKAVCFKDIEHGIYRVELPFTMPVFKSDSNHTSIGLAIIIQGMTKSASDSISDMWELKYVINKNSDK